MNHVACAPFILVGRIMPNPRSFCWWNPHISPFFRVKSVKSPYFHIFSTFSYWLNLVNITSPLDPQGDHPLRPAEAPCARAVSRFLLWFRRGEPPPKAPGKGGRATSSCCPVRVKMPGYQWVGQCWEVRIYPELVGDGWGMLGSGDMKWILIAIIEWYSWS